MDLSHNMPVEEHVPRVYFESQSHAVTRQAMFDILRMWTYPEGRYLAYLVNTSMQATIAPEAPLVAYQALTSPRINLRRQMEALKLHWETTAVQYHAAHNEYRNSLVKYSNAGSLEQMNNLHEEIQKHGSRSRDLYAQVTQYHKQYDMMEQWVRLR